MLAVLHPFDLALLRAAAGRIAFALENRLPQAVCGYRTVPEGAAWRFRHDGSSGWKHFTEAAVSILRRQDVNAMCSTDIASYYPSIRLDALEEKLRALPADGHAVSTMMAGLRGSYSNSGYSGIPIGPEACAVLGNAFLLDIDERLISIGVAHLRWMDDYRIFGTDEKACHIAIIPLDESLASRGLLRSLPKTICNDACDALLSIRDGRLVSLGYWLSSGRPDTAFELHRSWDYEIAQDTPSPSRFRYILKALKNTSDDYAAKDVVSDLDTACVDPKLSGDYLQMVGLRHPRIADELLSRLCELPCERREAVHLHFLRASAARVGEWGEAEGKVFDSIVADQTRRSPTRCWAVVAQSHSCAWRQSGAMERAEAEPDPLIQRALVTTLVKARDGRKRRAFLEHMRTQAPDLGFTLRWVERAA